MKIVPNVNVDFNRNKAISCVSYYTTGNIAIDQMPRNANEFYKIEWNMLMKLTIK